MFINEIRMLSCREWGAKPAKETIIGSIADKIILHHMASANPPDNISKSDPCSIAKECQKWHFARDWIDTGQHFTISTNGTILEGRHGSIEALKRGICVVGAHCPGQNISWGIEIEGDHRSLPVTKEQEESLIALCALICLYCKIDSSRIFGHRDFFATECPGDAIWKKLPDIRKKVHNKILQMRTERR